VQARTVGSVGARAFGRAGLTLRAAAAALSVAPATAHRWWHRWKGSHGRRRWRVLRGSERGACGRPGGWAPRVRGANGWEKHCGRLVRGPWRRRVAQGTVTHTRPRRTPVPLAAEIAILVIVVATGCTVALVAGYDAIDTTATMVILLAVAGASLVWRRRGGMSRPDPARSRSVATSLRRAGVLLLALEGIAALTLWLSGGRGATAVVITMVATLVGLLAGLSAATSRKGS
jgi:hypothetical protein